MNQHYKPWTADQEALLRDMWADPSLTQEDMSERLGRGVNAIREHAKVYMKLPARQARVGKNKSFWLQGDRLSILERGFAAGKSFTQIAMDVGDGCTRNAAIGRAKRQGLTRSIDRWAPNRRPKPVSAAPKPRRAAKPRLVVCGNNTVIAHVERAPRAAAPKADVWAPLPDSKPRPFWERGIDFCSWPVEVEGAEPGTMRCCILATRSGLCADHAEIGFQPTNGSAKRAVNSLIRSVRRYAA